MCEREEEEEEEGLWWGVGGEGNGARSAEASAYKAQA